LVKNEQVEFTVKQKSQLIEIYYPKITCLPKDMEKGNFTEKPAHCLYKRTHSFFFLNLFFLPRGIKEQQQKTQKLKSLPDSHLGIEIFYTAAPEIDFIIQYL